MIKNVSVENCHAVFGEKECTYQSVLDDFPKAKFIGIMTFNISTKEQSHLLKALKNACLNGTDAIIITNIPKRFPSYFKPYHAKTAKEMINKYKEKLNPENYGMRLSPYFTFSNHAKVVMTDNIVYWGSGNFSDESSGNIECGTISTDRNLIKYLKGSFFPEVKAKSVSYYKYNIAVAIANMEDLIPACKDARNTLFEAAFESWADDDTNFEEIWVYRRYENGVTNKFLKGFMEFFSQFEDALSVIDDVIDEYCEFDEMPRPVKILQELLEKYNKTYDDFNERISSLFWDLEKMARYDASDEACKKIVNDYGMVAVDEDLDYYAEKAMSEALDEKEKLIEEAEQTIRDAIKNLDSMIQYFEELNTNLYQLLEVNSKIDNTGIN